jgi:hypothetical protein
MLPHCNLYNKLIQCIFIAAKIFTYFPKNLENIILNNPTRQEEANSLHKMWHITGNWVSRKFHTISCKFQVMRKVYNLTYLVYGLMHN